MIVRTFRTLRDWGICAVVFFLPWQTVWIMHSAVIGRVGAPLEGVWQYGVMRIYALDVLVWFTALCSIFFGIVFIWHIGVVAVFRLFCRSRFFILDVALFLLLLFAAWSLAWSSYFFVSLWAWIRLTEGIILFWIVRSSSIRLSVIAMFWIGAAFLQALVALFQFNAQSIVASTLLGISAHSPLQLGDSVIQSGDRRWLRAYGSFPHPNVLGAYLALAFGVCISAVGFFQRKWMWFLFVLSGSIITAGLFFSFSRSAWIALVFGGLCAVSLIFLKKKREKAAQVVQSDDWRASPATLCMICAVIVFGVLASVFHEELGVRFGATSSRLEQASINERVSLVQRALPLVRSQWYRGTGIGSFTGALFDYEKSKNIDTVWYLYQPIHNVPLLIGAELGVIGFFLSLGIFFLLFWYARFSSAAIAFLGMIATMSMTDHYFWTLSSGIIMFWLVGAIAVRSTLGKDSQTS